MKELIHFIPLIFFDTPWKHQKSSGPGLSLFSRYIERNQRHEMGKLSLNTPRNVLNTVKEHLITSHLITLCRNFVERHSFRIVSGKSPETMRKLCLSTKLPHQEIRRNYVILHDVLHYATLLKVTLLHRGFYCFLHCANSTKSRKTSSCDTYINTEAGQLMKLVAKHQLIALRNILQ